MHYAMAGLSFIILSETQGTGCCGGLRVRDLDYLIMFNFVSL